MNIRYPLGDNIVKKHSRFYIDYKDIKRYNYIQKDIKVYKNSARLFLFVFMIHI